MEYYRIIFDKMPSVRFAHKYETTEYGFEFEERKNFLEISYVETGEIIEENQKGRKLLKTPGIHISLYNYPRKAWSEAEFHRHFTVGINLEFEAFMVHDAAFSESDVNEDAMSLILSDAITDKECIKKAEALIKKIIFENAAGKESGRVKCSGLCLELMALISEFCKRQIAEDNSDISPSDLIYSDRISRYISKHIDCKISRTEIAEYIGISSGHMSRLFKSVNGCGITEYVNRLKINIAKNMLENKNATLSEVSQSIGIADEKYFCRLFKKHTGMTVGEYRNMTSVEPK